MNRQKVISTLLKEIKFCDKQILSPQTRAWPKSFYVSSRYKYAAHLKRVVNNYE